MRLLCSILLFFSCQSLLGQFEAFQFNNPNLPFSATCNPAFLPQKGFSLGSRAKLFLQLDQYSFYDVFRSDQNADETLNNLLNNPSKDLNNIQINSDITAMEIGIRSRNSYLHLSSSLSVDCKLNIDKNLIGLLFLGNGSEQYFNQNTSLDFSGTSVETKIHNRISYGRRVGSKIYIGINGTLINGLYHLNIDNAKFNILSELDTTSIYKITVGGQYNANSTGFDELLSLPVSPSLFIGAMPYLNYGQSIGAGLIYKPNDKWRFSISTDNHGYQEWNFYRSIHSLTEFQWQFQGIDSIQFNLIGNSISQQFADSVNHYIKPFNDESNRIIYNYKPRYLVGAEYLGIPRNKISLLYGTGYGFNGEGKFKSISDWVSITPWLDFFLELNSYSQPLKKENLINTGLNIQTHGMQIFAHIANVEALFSPRVEDYHYFISTGAYINLVQNIDSDSDDIPDHRDECPEIYGTVRYKGCPDHTFSQPYIQDPISGELLRLNRIEDRNKVIRR